MKRMLKGLGGVATLGAAAWAVWVWVYRTAESFLPHPKADLRFIMTSGPDPASVPINFRIRMKAGGKGPRVGQLRTKTSVKDAAEQSQLLSMAAFLVTNLGTEDHKDPVRISGDRL